MVPPTSVNVSQLSVGLSMIGLGFAHCYSENDWHSASSALNPYSEGSIHYQASQQITAVLEFLFSSAYLTTLKNIFGVLRFKIKSS